MRSISAARRDPRTHAWRGRDTSSDGDRETEPQVCLEHATVFPGSARSAAHARARRVVPGRARQDCLRPIRYESMFLGRKYQCRCWRPSAPRRARQRPGQIGPRVVRRSSSRQRATISGPQWPRGQRSAKAQPSAKRAKNPAKGSQGWSFDRAHLARRSVRRPRAQADRVGIGSAGGAARIAGRRTSSDDATQNMTADPVWRSDPTAGRGRGERRRCA